MESAEFRTDSLNFYVCDLKATGSFELEAVHVALRFALLIGQIPYVMLAGRNKGRPN
jgi:hypothetical protein